eukprot:TRINITY_DN472_c0_g1_i2.p1 TRINITY_DN472_c0_g1~~TRINITY_DN472_c0_g1_i2.p1  ORF type:complete len:476 (+),score=105.34 TRINITY_DN472_c0_g1_i2:39-1466(+)
MIVRRMKALHPAVQRRLCTMSILTDQPMPPAYQELGDEMARPMATSSNTGWGNVEPRNALKRNKHNAQLPRNWFNEDDYVPETRGPAYNQRNEPPKDRQTDRPQRAERPRTSQTPQTGNRPQAADRPRTSQQPRQSNPRQQEVASRLAMPAASTFNKPPASMTDFHKLSMEYGRGSLALHKDVDMYVAKKIKSLLGTMSFLEKVEAIGLAGKIGRPELGLSILTELPEPNAKAYTLAMSGFAKQGNFPKMQEVWAQMRRAGLVANVFTYNVVMNCFAEMRDENRARELITIMHEDGVAPDLVTYNTAIRSCKSIESAMRFYREACEAKFAADKFTLVNLLDVCMHTGDVSASQLVINDMASKDLLPDVKCCNVLMRMHLKLKDASSLLGVVSTMAKEQIQQNTESLEILSELCLMKVQTHSDRWHTLATTVFSDLTTPRVNRRLSAKILENIAAVCKKVGDSEGEASALKLIISS